MKSQFELKLILTTVIVLAIAAAAWAISVLTGESYDDTLGVLTLAALGFEIANRIVERNGK